MQTGGHGNQSVAVLSEDLFIDPGFVVKSFKLGNGGQFTEVAVTFLIFGQQDQVRKIPVVYRCFVESGSGGHINFDADNGFDAGLGRFFIKLDRAEHGAVIGDGHRMHAELGGPLQKVVDANGPIQQAVLGVDMEVNKIRNVGDSCHRIKCFLRVERFGFRVTG